MTIDARQLAARQSSLREPQPKERRVPVRKEVVAGGAGIRWVVLRLVDVANNRMMAQRVRYQNPSEPVPGEVEAVGDEFQVHPMIGATVAMYSFAEYSEEDEAADPLATRFLVCKAYNVDGATHVEPALKFIPTVKFLDQDAPISEAAGG